MQCGIAAILAFRKLLAHQKLCPGLVGDRAEAEARRISPQVDRPAGQQLGEIGDIRLSVASGRTDRVQFQAFACQVLVEAAMAALARRAVWPNRPGIVEIHQHRRMAHDGEQHVLEPPGDVRADRLLDEGASSRRHTTPDRDGEVIGPEPHQPLTEGPRRGQRILQSGRGLGVVQSAARAARRVAASQPDPARSAASPRAGARPRLADPWVWVRQLAAQPLGRIARHTFPTTATQPEAHKCLCSTNVHDRAITS